MNAHALAGWIATLALAFIAPAPAHAQKGPAPSRALGDVPYAYLPAEAKYTISLIRKGGPFPYAKDGAIFGNREAILPKRNRGYYREYTVKTPGERTRGARRIIWGRSGEFYYTEDHYNHFKRVRE